MVHFLVPGKDMSASREDDDTDLTLYSYFNLSLCDMLSYEYLGKFVDEYSVKYGTSFFVVFWLQL